MPRIRDVLHRFRPAGAPGAATAAGVPVDRAAELGVELEPLFALLADTERECEDVLERARAEQAGIRARDAERAAGVLASGRARVEAERAAAASRSRGAGPGRTTDASAPGGVEPAAGGARADEALAQHVGLVVDAVRSLVGRAGSGDAPLAGAP